MSGMTAMGYGEAVPIADNQTDAGREANRRIEFTLSGQVVEATSPDETGAAKQVGPSKENAPLADAGPDFSADTSPSIAPKDQTRRPRTRSGSND